MIDSIGQVMLYVKNPIAVADFWIDKIGFVVIGQAPAPGGSNSIEIAPTPQSVTHFVLFDREQIAKMDPELNLGTPSIMFNTNNVSELHKKLEAEGITVGKIIDIMGKKTFNFSDPEGNYFAVHAFQ